jgi:hypothetical protein
MNFIRTDLTSASARPLRRAADFSGLQILVLFGLFTLVASIPIITHQLPPLSDYVNHLSRMHVIATVGSDPDLARFYEIQWQIIPNLVMDVVVPVLNRFMNVYHAGQLFTVLGFVLIMSGTLTLNRALFGHWSVFPLVALPLLYNYVFLVGVMNYVFGIGLALWGLAAWVVLRERAWPLRLLVSTVFAVGLFFCHLFVVGLYGMGLLAIELQRLWARRKEPISWLLIDFCATGIPFLPLVPLLLKSPTFELATENLWEHQGKIDGLVYVIQVYSDIVAFALTAIAITGAVWAVRHRLLWFHPVGWAMLGVGTVVYLAMPRILFATYMADQRLPIALAFMLIAGAHLEMRHRLVRRGFLALLLVMLVVRVIEVDVAWADLSRVQLEFRESVKRIKRGSTVLVAFADRAAGDDVRDLGLVHAVCLAVIERSALVTTAFTVRGKQIMHVRRDYRGRVDTEDGTPPSVEQLLVAAERTIDTQPYWQMWRQNFDYVYIIFTEQDADNPAPELLTLMQDGERFQLYRINKKSAALPAPRASATR